MERFQKAAALGPWRGVAQQQAILFYCIAAALASFGPLQHGFWVRVNAVFAFLLGGMALDNLPHLLEIFAQGTEGRREAIAQPPCRQWLGPWTSCCASVSSA
jgi:hypothetical protein